MIGVNNVTYYQPNYTAVYGPCLISMNALSIDDIPDLRQKVEAGWTHKQIQREYGISHITTVARFCQRHGISRFKEVTDDEAGALVAALKTDSEGQPMREAWGEHKVYDCFAALNIRIPRAAVRRAMHSQDADGIARRKRRAIVRREYHAPYPNFVWHCDTNMKLARWGIWIYGTVDGYSRFLPYLVAADNISKQTGVLLHGRAILEYLVVPDLLRVDAGGENNSAVALQRELGGAVHAGSSVHNQPIERFWGICRSHVAEPYRRNFFDLERDGDLDITNECHLDALRHAFLPGIQEECDVFRLMHNAAYKPGHGKASVAFNGAVPPRDTTFVWGDFLARDFCLQPKR